jgi:hypothetical protein
VVPTNFVNGAMPWAPADRTPLDRTPLDVAVNVRRSPWSRPAAPAGAESPTIPTIPTPSITETARSRPALTPRTPTI